MQKYFISDEEFLNKNITSDDVFHIKSVMRFNIGDQILIGNNGKSYLSTIKEINKNSIAFEIIEEIIGNNELPVFVSIYQGYPKGDKIEDIIKHSTEMGVYNIIPTMMKRSVVHLDDKKRESRIIRLRRIAKEAAEQSYRNIIPNVFDITDLKKCDFSEFDYKILCYEEDAKSGEVSNYKNILKKLKPNDKIAVVIGPEGGIDDTEVKYLTELGFISCGLGNRILRCETVYSYILSSISYEMELK